MVSVLAMGRLFVVEQECGERKIACCLNRLHQLRNITVCLNTTNYTANNQKPHHRPLQTTEKLPTHNEKSDRGQKVKSPTVPALFLSRPPGLFIPRLFIPGLFTPGTTVTGTGTCCRMYSL